MRKKGTYIINIAGIIGFFAIWQVLSLVIQSPAVPSLPKILLAFKDIIQSNEIYGNIFGSLKLVLIGVAIAFSMGTLTGLLCNASTIIDGLLSPLLEGARSIAAITLFPLLIVLFGIGDLPRIIVIFWTAFPATVLCTIQGLKSVNKTLIEAGRGMGANELQVYLYIKIPLAIPQILNGLRISLGNGFIAIVVAEMLGASKGLGFMVQWTTQSFKYPHTYAYIFTIAIVGGLINYSMNLIIKRIERKLLT